MIAERIVKAIEELEEESKKFFLDYKFYGIRFERRHNLEEGYELECSKANRDRVDAREFPVFGTPEYEEMDELDGTCAYFVFDGEKEERSKRLNHILNNYISEESDEFTWYLVGAEDLSDEEGEDDDEIIMKDAVVVKKI